MFKKSLLTLTALFALSVLSTTTATPADAAVKITKGAKTTATAKPKKARGGYARWLQHGDVYKVKGQFGSFNQSFNVSLAWKGSGFVVNTPLGAYRLKRRGSGVSFKVYFQKAWAHVTWKRSRAFVKYKGQGGSASVVKVGNKSARTSRVKRKQNFN